MTNSGAVAHALRKVFDPELNIDIIALGLVYAIDADEQEVTVEMTTTSEMCPMGDVLRRSALDVLRAAFPDRRVSVEMVSEPPWGVGMLEQSARRSLGLKSA